MYRERCWDDTEWSLTVLTELSYAAFLDSLDGGFSMVGSYCS